MIRPASSRPPGLLRTHVWLLALATLVAVGAAIAVALTRPVTYTSTAEVVVSPEDTGSTPLKPDMGTERAIARSGLVADRAAAQLAMAPQHASEGLTVAVVLESSVLRISYAGSSPYDAQRGADAFADAYVDYRNSQVRDDVATLVTPASLPSQGSRGSLAIFVGLGLLGGLSVGITAAWLWDRWSGRVRSGDELALRSGLPVLLGVPAFDSRRHPLPAFGPAHDAFAYLAVKVLSMTGQETGGETGRCVVVTSPRAGAGTTTVACGTAAALAAQGTEVVLVAGHGHGLLPEQVHGARPTPGLRQLLDGRCSVDQALHTTSMPHLKVVPTGGALGEELELPALRRALEKLGSRGTLVVDTPPLLGSPRSLLLAELADVVVLVGDMRSGSRSDVAAATGFLDGVAPAQTGWVTNLPRRSKRSDLAVLPLLGTPPTSPAGPRPGPAEPGETPAATSTTGAPANLANGANGAKKSRQGRLQRGRRTPGAPRRTSPPPDADPPGRAPASSARGR